MSPFSVWVNIAGCGFAAHIKNKTTPEIVALIEGLLDSQVDRSASNKDEVRPRGIS